jgi:hypothetical protein
VYDEIVSIDDIGFEAIATEGAETPTEPFTEARFSDPTIRDRPRGRRSISSAFPSAGGYCRTRFRNVAVLKTIEEEDRLILGGIVNTDYLSFDKKLDELRNTTPAASNKGRRTATGNQRPRQKRRKYRATTMIKCHIHFYVVA